MTTATTWRKERGRETERLLAAWFRDHGWPYAEPVGAGRPGRDITGMPGLAIESKATKALSPLLWLRQAERHAGDDDYPAVVWRPDHGGPSNMDEWVVVMRLDEFTRLVTAAGYGTADDECPICHDTYTDSAGVTAHLASGRKGCGPELERSLRR